MRELRSALSDLRLNDLAVGNDGHNRTILSAFRARTGRNQPSNTHFIFGPSVWLRGLMKPPPARASPISTGSNKSSASRHLLGDPVMMDAYNLATRISTLPSAPVRCRRTRRKDP